MFSVMTWAAGSNSFSLDHRPVRADAKAVMTAAKVRLAMAAMGTKGNESDGFVQR
jgi:hypothetical protein